MIEIYCRGRANDGSHRRKIATFTRMNGVWRPVVGNSNGTESGKVVGAEFWEYLHEDVTLTVFEIGNLVRQGRGDEIRRRYKLPPCPKCGMSVPVKNSRFSQVLDKAESNGVSMLRLQDIANMI